MNDLYNRQFDMLSRVSAFGSKHADLFPPVSLGGRLFDAITSSIVQVSKNAGSQAAGLALIRAGSTSKAEARAVLMDCLDAITLTARAMARDSKPIRDLFQMPPRPTNKGLITTARGFVANAAPIKDQFIAYEMAPNFLQELEEAISGFETSLERHSDAKKTQASNFDSIADAITKAMDAIYRLDGIVPNKAKNNSPVLKEWETARRVARARVSPKPEVDSDSSGPSPTAAATAQA